jgi:hypothetical protein
VKATVEEIPYRDGVTHPEILQRVLGRLGAH